MEDCFCIFKLSENTLVLNDISNKYCSGSCSSPKQFLIMLKVLQLQPELLFVFGEKVTSFNSFIDKKCVVIVPCTCFIKLGNGFEGLGISRTNFGPIFLLYWIQPQFLFDLPSLFCYLLSSGVDEFCI